MKSFANLHDMYYFFTIIGMDGRDLDSFLEALPWKEIERKEDGTIIKVCNINEINLCL